VALVAGIGDDPRDKLAPLQPYQSPDPCSSQRIMLACLPYALRWSLELLDLITNVPVDGGCSWSKGMQFIDVALQSSSVKKAHQTV